MNCYNTNEFVEQEHQHADQVNSEQKQRKADHACCLNAGSLIFFVDIPDRLDEIAETIQYSFHGIHLSNAAS